MASLQGNTIKDTYKSLLKVADNGELEATEQEITDGNGNGTGVSLNTSGDVTATGTVSFGSLKDTGENITITKFVDAADGIGNNDNDGSIPTSAAVKSYVDTNVTAQDLDITDGTNNGSVDLDSQSLTFTGDAGVSATVSGQTLTLDSSALQAQITSNDTDITALQAADVTLQNNIDSEASTRATADTTLQTNIDNEEAARITADSGLQTQITSNDSDITALQAEDVTLQSNIDTEEAARIAADTTLQSNIDSEASTRATADTTLQSNIDAEATARASADTALQTQITSNDSDISALDGRLTTAEGNISSNDTDIANLQSDKYDKTGGTISGSVTVTGDVSATNLTGTVSATSVLADGVTATTQSAGDNSTKVATTAYVDSIVTAQDLDFAGDSGTGAVDLDSQTFTIAGTANEIETVASGQTVTIGLPNNVNVAGNLTVDTNTLYANSSTNRVGIGTTSPDLRLHIKDSQTGVLKVESSDANGGNAQFARDGITDGYIGCAAGFLTSMGTGDFAIRSQAALGFGTGGNNERMRIDSSGNVGVGVVPSAWTSAGSTKALQISTMSAVFEAYSGTFLSNNIYFDGSTKHITTAPAARLGLLSDGALQFMNAPSGTAGSAASLVERMRINSSGNVGIGTSSPSSAGSGYTGLDIRGSGGASIRYGVTSGFNMLTYATGTATDFVPSAASDIRFFNKTGVTESIRFQSGGGISFNGDTAAANALDDYEEGTWTVEIADAGTGGNTASIGTQACKYTKIGNQVFVTALIGNINTSGMTGGNPLFVRGLPYQASESSYGTVVLDGFTFTGNYCVLAVSSLGSYGTISQITSNANDGALLVSAVDGSTSDILFSATYRV